MKLRSTIMAGVVLALAGCINSYGEYKDLGVVKTIDGKDYRIVQSTKSSDDAGVVTKSTVFLLYPVWMPPAQYHGANAFSECTQSSASQCGPKFEASVDFYNKYKPDQLLSPMERSRVRDSGGDGGGDTH